MSSTYITKQNDRMDRICYNFYGDDDNEIVETVIAANPGVEVYGILLPLGISITLPDRPQTSTSPPIIKIHTLW